MWAAILGSTFLFGAVHVLNGLVTGDFLASSVQAVAAFMTGIAFMAIRIRTGSLYPGMVLHGVWDFALITIVAGVSARYGAPSASAASTLGWFMLAPVVFIMPNFLYGLFLLRHARRDEATTA